MTNEQTHTWYKSLFNKFFYANWKAIYEIKKVDCYGHYIHKWTSKWITDLNIRPETINCVEEIIATKLTYLAFKEDLNVENLKDSKTKSMGSISKNKWMGICQSKMFLHRKKERKRKEKEEGEVEEEDKKR